MSHTNTCNTRHWSSLTSPWRMEPCFWGPVERCCPSARSAFICLSLIQLCTSVLHYLINFRHFTDNNIFHCKPTHLGSFHRLSRRRHGEVGRVPYCCHSVQFQFCIVIHLYEIFYFNYCIFSQWKIIALRRAKYFA
jgi:hypothetical protein